MRAGYRGVGDREFGQVVADHLRLDFDVDESLAVVDADNAADHLRHDHLSDWKWIRPIQQEYVYGIRIRDSNP